MNMLLFFDMIDHPSLIALEPLEGIFPKPRVNSQVEEFRIGIPLTEKVDSRSLSLASSLEDSEPDASL